MWPLLLEKAWAKTMGGYTNAEKGLPENALSGLMGVPVYRILPAEFDADFIFKFIQKEDDLGYPMTATTGSAENSVNLPTERTYSILSAFKLKRSDDADEELMYFMLDPSGEKNYQGSLKDLIDPSLPAT